MINWALVYLKIDGASPIATYTTSAGNFLLPIKGLLSENLTNLFNINENTKAQLIIQRLSQKSTISLTLPIDNRSLPPITLGENINLEEFLATASAKIIEPVVATSSATASARPRPSNKFDLNNDLKVNSIDLSILLDDLIKRPSNNQGDFNNDGKVDQKDVDLIKGALQ